MTAACNCAAGQAAGCTKHARVSKCCTESTLGCHYSLVDAYRQSLSYGCMPAALKLPPGPSCRPQPVPTGGRGGPRSCACLTCSNAQAGISVLDDGCSGLATHPASQHAQQFLQAEGQNILHACMPTPGCLFLTLLLEVAGLTPWPQLRAMGQKDKPITQACMSAPGCPILNHISESAGLRERLPADSFRGVCLLYVTHMPA